MKKLFVIFITLLVIALGFLYWRKHTTPIKSTDQVATSTPTADLDTFVSADQSITFQYPPTLSVSQKNNIITIRHQIAYAHIDACDFKGTATTTSTLTDFKVTMQVFNQSVADTARTVSPYIPKENFQGETLKINPGFIDTYNAGKWNGYSILEGAEGCGQITYYIPLSDSRTLVIQNQLIGEFSGVADPAQKEKILAVPGVISPDNAKTIFSQIIQSLDVQ